MAEEAKRRHVKYRRGMVVATKIPKWTYRSLGDRNPEAGYDTDDCILLRPARGTPYQSTDWIVCKLKHPKSIFGLDEKYITRIVSERTPAGEFWEGLEQLKKELRLTNEPSEEEV